MYWCLFYSLVYHLWEQIVLDRGTLQATVKLELKAAACCTTPSGVDGYCRMLVYSSCIIYVKCVLHVICRHTYMYYVLGHLSFIDLFWQPVGITTLNIFETTQIPGALPVSPPQIWSFCAMGKNIAFCPFLIDVLDFILSLGEWTDLENERIVLAPAIQHHPSQWSSSLIPCTSPFKFRHSQVHTLSDSKQHHANDPKHWR